MVQDWTMPIATGDTIGPSLLAKLNAAMAALRTVHSGASVPSSTVAYMLWMNTATLEVNQRSAADDADNPILASNVRNHGVSAIIRIGGLAASANFFVYRAAVAFHVDDLYVISDTTTSGSDGSNKYAFQLRNLTAGDNLLGTAKDTQATEITLDVPYAIGPDQNQNVAAGDLLEIQVTKTGAPTDYTSAELTFILEGWLRGA